MIKAVASNLEYNPYELISFFMLRNLKWPITIQVLQLNILVYNPVRNETSQLPVGASG